MASRTIVPQQPRVEAVVGEGKEPQKALSDIGNLANLRGVVNRPITSFGAQLLANAQAAAAAENNTKQACPNVAAPLPVANAVAVAKKVPPKGPNWL